MAVVRAAFKPEFLNRLDDIVVFDALDTRGARRASSTSRSAALARRLADRRLTLEVTAGGPGVAGPRRASTRCTARGRCAGWCRRAIGDQLAKALLAGEVRDGDTVTVDRDGEANALALRPVETERV